MFPGFLSFISYLFLQLCFLSFSLLCDVVCNNSTLYLVWLCNLTVHVVNITISSNTDWYCIACFLFSFYMVSILCSVFPATQASISVYDYLSSWLIGSLTSRLWSVSNVLQIHLCFSHAFSSLIYSLFSQSVWSLYCTFLCRDSCCFKDVRT